MASIQEFRAHVRSVGLPLGCYFFVVLPNLPGVSNQDTTALLCDSASLPGVNVASNQLKIAGEASDIAFGIDYAPVQLQFMLDHKMDALKYFTYWNGMAFDRASRTAGYFDDYAQDLSIFVTDKNGKMIHGVKLISAWPKTITDVPVSSGAREVMQLSVAINYRFWEQIEFDQAGNQMYAASNGAGAGRGVSQLLSSDVYKETLGNSNMSAVGAIPSFGDIPGAPGLAAVGSTMSTDFARCGKNAYTVLTAPGAEISHPSEPAFGSKLGGLMGSLGSTMSQFGSGVTGLGKAVSAFTGPAFAAGNALGAVAGQLGAIDGLLKKVGISSGLGAQARNLAQMSGKVKTIAGLNGVPGSMVSVGSSMGAVGASFAGITKSIAALPGASKSAAAAVGTMGSAFSKNGTNLSNTASSIPPGP